MENHPIPQDITGFQFKLIGNMTVKQFAYLAGGAVCTWLTIVSPVFIVVKIFLSVFFVFFGIAFAFVPLEGRPIDAMIKYFIKALFNPTQFVYQKIGADLYFPEQKINKKTVTTGSNASKASRDKLKTFLSAFPKRPKNKLDEKEMVFLQNLPSFAPPTPTLTPSPSSQQKGIHIGIPSFGDLLKGFSHRQTPPIPTSAPKKGDSPIPQKPELKNQEKAVQNEEVKLKTQLASAKKEEAKQATGTKGQEEAHQKVTQLENLLNDVAMQKRQLENQLVELQKKLQVQKKQVYTPSVATSEESPKQTKRVRSIPKEMSKSVGIPVAPEFPNVITGIIKDPRNNPLPGILVEVKDKEGNPVRAFKTNPLGQFASATPLSNGTYTIDFEDPNKKNSFDAVEFTASGEVILPLEIISADEREELRKSLFGN